MGNDNEANRIVNEALKRIPNSGELHYARSQLMSREARLEEVERELLKAIELNPTLGAAYHDLSALLMRAGRPDEALFAKASFNRLTEYDRARAFLIQRRPLIPDHPGIPMMLGELELSANMFNEAERWFSRSESLSGDVSRIAAGRATVAFLNGQDDRGRRQLAAMGEWADPRGYLAQAARHLSEGSLETSAALVDRAVNAAPEEKEFFHLAALLSEQLHRPGRAIELLDHATNVPHARAPGLATVADSGDKQQKSRSTP
jgi:tetratricopeptide (TPR) repeat protein